MNSSPNNVSPRHSSKCACAIDRYTTAWSLGTGVPTALQPGVYSVTDSIRVDGIRFVTLDGRYRVAAHRCKTA